MKAQTNKTDQAAKDEITKFAKVVSKCIHELEESTNVHEYICREHGWDDIYTAFYTKEAIEKLAVCLAALTTWFDDEDEQDASNN